MSSLTALRTTRSAQSTRAQPDGPAVAMQVALKVTQHICEQAKADNAAAARSFVLCDPPTPGASVPDAQRVLSFCS